MNDAVKLCPFCKKLPGQKAGPPAMARCITPECEGRNLAAVTLGEWNNDSPHTDAGALLKLAECPFCKRAVMLRKALHVSDGNVDAIIHAAPTNCGMVEFADGTTDESIVAKWNHQAASQGIAGGEQRVTIVNKGRAVAPRFEDESVPLAQGALDRDSASAFVRRLRQYNAACLAYDLSHDEAIDALLALPSAEGNTP